MNCDEFRAAVPEHARGRLSPEESARVERHHRDCEECVDFNRTFAELLCSDYVQFLGDFVDGLLPEQRRSIFERHLTVCADCTKYTDAYRLTIRMSGMTSQDSEDPATEQIVHSVLQEFQPH